ncbi:CRISPR/Cas system CSM-associated protein Csm3, group 7 of RAMP superfamily [Haloechinothrix alba]|uniref:CRISPR/Cas system CSM-associated protein Csm3, group 7 of RAMP superfamily n=1 Tax=Haloechinothrix alba TaxID=664784 RepID=A0A238ZXP6_9PSEU|nr:RAMP superfamily CRISPR-associated protein [Haloechinothrix alba]SNR87902.1 CRISPR/Cas system CSM-associated protein Csm3, group 7 of RAMP superfamily [Haloechinothrix alba]
MKVTLFTVRVRMLSPGGVGGSEASRDAGNTLGLRRDPWDRPHLPGTTVAGNLRDHCRRVAPDLQDAFGRGGDDLGRSDSVRRGSDIQVLGTHHRHGTSSVRTRTAIDPLRGAARSTSLHQVEQLPAGTEFDIVLRWDDVEPHRREKFVEVLRAWQPRFGRGASYGAGRCAVVGLGVADYDLTTRDGLYRWLQQTESQPYPDPEPLSEAPAEPSWAVDVRFDIVDGIHIGGGEPPEDAENGDVEVGWVQRDSEGRPVVPGSSLKGVLRSRAEYVCRVVGATTCHGDERGCGADACRPCRIFGYTDGTGKARRAAVAVHDSPIENERTEIRCRVAIDRFTGGARDQHLYHTELVVAGSSRLRVEELAHLDAADRLLLHAVVADLHDGLVGLGARTTAGQGTVVVSDGAWSRPDLEGVARQLCGSDGS